MKRGNGIVYCNNMYLISIYYENISISDGKHEEHIFYRAVVTFSAVTNQIPFSQNIIHWTKQQKEYSLVARYAWWIDVVQLLIAR